MRIETFINNYYLYSQRFSTSLLTSNRSNLTFWGLDLYLFGLAMPYRRLPNTDAARIKAMKTALKKGKEIPPQLVAYSARNIVKLQQFLPRFEQNIMLQRQTQSTQSKRSKNYYEIQHKAKIYLTHFVRVMNMAVIRGELPKSIRQNYGIEIDDSNVPSFNTECDLIKWGHMIIEGEEKRLMKGGSPITNPSIAVVKVWFENFWKTTTSIKPLLKEPWIILKKHAT